MKTNKKITLAILIIGAVFGCTKILDESLPSEPTEEQFINSEANFDKVAVGIYQKLQFFYRWDGGGSWVHGAWHLPGDNLTVATGARSAPYENFSDLNPTTSGLGNFFNWHYHLIGRANALLDLQERFGDEVYIDPGLREIHSGEALFLRGYMMLRLWNYWGTAPLNTDRVLDLSEVFLPNSSGTELIDQAIQDLSDAAGLLSDTPLDPGRVWNESAYGMLGKALMIRGTHTNNPADFTEAIAAFSNVTSRSLMADYEENFLPTTEDNDESLFEVQLGNNLSNNNIWLNNDNFDVIGDLSGTWVFYDVQGDPAWLTDQTFVPTDGFLSLLDAADPRAAVLVNPSFTRVNKYVSQPKLATTIASSWNNPRILRYADVLLLHAEALVRSGGPASEAIGLINQVRTGARNMGTAGIPADYSTTETNTNTILGWIFDERRIELAFEEDHCWQDLRRRHVAGEIDLTSPGYDWGGLQPVNFREHNILFPFPNSELLVNPNLQQNTGY